MVTTIIQNHGMIFPFGMEAYQGYGCKTDDPIPPQHYTNSDVIKHHFLSLSFHFLAIIFAAYKQVPLFQCSQPILFTYLQIGTKKR